MKGYVITEVCRLWEIYGDLLKEKKNLRGLLSNEDIQLVQEKVGKRFIRLTVEDVRKDIDKDIAETERKIKTLVGGFDYEVGSKLRSSMRELVQGILDKYYGGYNNLPDNLRIIINDVIEDKVKKVISDLS